MGELKEEVIEDVKEVVTITREPECNICGSKEKLWLKPFGLVRCQKHYDVGEYKYDRRESE
jgi:hypothetical protein